MIQTIARLSAMPEAQREQIFKTVSPALLAFIQPDVECRSTRSWPYDTRLMPRPRDQSHLPSSSQSLLTISPNRGHALPYDNILTYR